MADCAETVQFGDQSMAVLLTSDFLLSGLFGLLQDLTDLKFGPIPTEQDSPT